MLRAFHRATFEVRQCRSDWRRPRIFAKVTAKAQKAPL
jgi:hypothetical protein